MSRRSNEFQLKLCGSFLKQILGAKLAKGEACYYYGGSGGMAPRKIENCIF